MNARMLGLRGLGIHSTAMGRAGAGLAGLRNFRMAAPRATGISGLDAKLGGGMPNASFVLLTSAPSNGPYLLLERFAATGVELGERVCYISLERPADEVRSRVEYLARPGSSGSLEIIDLYTPAIERMKNGQEAAGQAADLARQIIDPVVAPGSPERFRLCIESVTELVRIHGAQRTTNLMARLAGVLHGSDGVGMAILDQGMFPGPTEVAFRHLADGIIDFGVDRDAYDVHPFLTVSKMRGVPDANHVCWYKETEQGLELECVKRVS